MVDPAALADRGYATTPLLDGAELDRARALWAGLGVDPDLTYYTTNVHADRATARRVDLKLKAILGPAAARVLPGHEPFLAAFILKGRHGGEVSLHPDWTYTDERRHRAVLFWCPLVDADAENGTLHVVPHSHRWVHGLRGSGDFPSPVEGVADELVAERAVTVALRAGEAVVYDAALLHGSAPSRQDRPRPAAALAVAPHGAPLVHFHRDPGGPVEGHRIDESWFTTQPYGARPTGCEPVEPWDRVVRPVVMADPPTAAGDPSARRR